MNSLEFIEEEIEQLEERKEKAFKNEYYSIYKECSQKITALHQIKAELEAWEICKNKLNLKVQTEEAVTEGFCMKGYWLLVEQYPYTQTTILEQEEYEILKKALEVKENEKSN